MIVPIGLTWEQKHLVRGRVLADIGEPFAAKEWLTADGADDAEAVRALTDEFAERLAKRTLNLSSTADLDLLSAADRIYSRQKALHGYRERDLLADRVPRLRRFAKALAWLCTQDAETYRALARRVYRIDRVSRALGAEAGAVPPRYPVGSVVQYTIREGPALLLGLPLAIVGSVIWYPAWLAPRWVLSRADPEYESIAMYKLAASFFTIPLTTVIVTVAGFFVAGTVGAIVAGIATPALGLVAIAWRERWSRVKEDSKLFLRVFSRRPLRERLSEQRKELTAEFDEVVRRMAE